MVKSSAVCRDKHVYMVVEISNAGKHLWASHARVSFLGIVCFSTSQLTSGKVLAFQKKKRVRQHVFGSSKVIACAASQFALFSRWLIYQGPRNEIPFSYKSSSRFVLSVHLPQFPWLNLHWWTQKFGATRRNFVQTTNVSGLAKSPLVFTFLLKLALGRCLFCLRLFVTDFTKIKWPWKPA